MKNKIVLVPFPFDDFSSVKVRPAVCLTGLIGKHKHIVIAFVSSKISSATELSDMVLSNNDRGFSSTGLKVSSVIRLHRVVTIPVTLIKRDLGILPSSYKNELHKKLKTLFQLK